MHTLSELLDSRDVRTPSAEPQDSRQPFGQWYCPNEDCVVRQVHVACSLLDFGDAVPEMWCPGCGSSLEFHHWWHVETLLEVG